MLKEEHYYLEVFTVYSLACHNRRGTKMGYLAICHDLGKKEWPDDGNDGLDAR